MAESTGRAHKTSLSYQELRAAQEADMSKKIAKRNAAIASRPDKKQPRPNPDLNLGQKDVNRKLSISTTTGNPPLRPGAHGMLPVGKSNPGGTVEAAPSKNIPKPTSKPLKPATPGKVKVSVGSAGAASNRDLPGKTTITYAPAKKDVAKLQAASKASLADSKAAAAARSNGPGGGADRALAYQRGQKVKRLVGGAK